MLEESTDECKKAQDECTFLFERMGVKFTFNSISEKIKKYLNDNLFSILTLGYNGIINIVNYRSLFLRNFQNLLIRIEKEVLNKFEASCIFKFVSQLYKRHPLAPNLLSIFQIQF